DPGWRVFWCSCRDRFSDEGIIGVALVETNDAVWRLDSFLLSCRVLGRGVEKAFLSVIVANAVACGATTILSEYIPTPKNMPAADFFAACGFHADDPVGQCSVWRLELPATVPFAPSWVKIMCGTTNLQDAS
ncbi:MAG: hypothetical protein WCN98_10130, partial [Verrucomicrobiaceae bacterium]